MTNSPCEDKQAAGHLVWHKVKFHGPVAGRKCDLPENQSGTVDHEFINGSIYQQTFATSVSTQPTALRVAGPASPPPVVVTKAFKGWLRSQPTTGIAAQALEHVPATGVVLPLTATAEFTTTVTPPWNTPSSPSTPPTVSITLTA